MSFVFEEENSTNRVRPIVFGVNPKPKRPQGTNIILLIIAILLFLISYYIATREKAPVNKVEYNPSQASLDNRFIFPGSKK